MLLKNFIRGLLSHKVNFKERMLFSNEEDRRRSFLLVTVKAFFKLF